MTKFTSSVLVCLMFAAMVPSAHAQAGLSDTLFRTGLSQDDIDLMAQTADSLYRNGAPRVGRTQSWSNAETGAKGSVKLVAFRGNCAYLQHFILTTRRPKPQEFRFKTCKTADGNWVLSP